ncbi:urea carboxylase [Zavarzinia sp. CC-PAN008]|uniref:urea carboxylase n=1 Tax=Zavarzinia sp. CC-PAN008 TaxID=3243332 RepID=UPI003F7466F8
MFSKVLIANRGEIAGRIQRTLKAMGIGSVAICSEADRFAAPVLAADEVVCVGPAPARDSYLNVEAILAACQATGAQAVHPGYGFLSENAAFAERLAEIGVAFIGPRPEHLREFGLKHRAREIAKASGVPLLPGSDLLASADEAVAAAEGIGYPVMLKSTAGGGGIGMQLCGSAADLRAKYETVQRTSTASFGDARVYLERFVARARHVEVQIFGDGQGGVVALGDRDCSLQRRNQKVIEEAPAPALPDGVRARLHAAAIALGQAVSYESAGTVEFIYDAAREEFYFLEVNTRLQVEHPVTEAVFGVDLVEWMIRQAAGDFVLPDQESLNPRGWAIEARVYAEAPELDFRPQTGRLTDVEFPEDVRVDTWIASGTEITPFYDPLIAKVIVAADTRDEAISGLSLALLRTILMGVPTNLDYLRAIASADGFRSADVSTAFLKDMPFVPRTVQVLASGAQTSIQEWPGRTGYWAVGVPPSGPMDDRSFRLANRLVGNDEGTTALECTVAGPTLKFDRAALIALTGAVMPATLEGAAVPHGRALAVAAGQVLVLGTVQGAGQRTYLAVRGGFEAAQYLGSRATFGLGKFGGHGSGAVRTGDLLRLGDEVNAAGPPETGLALPDLPRHWELAVRYGPHGAPDFFTEQDITTLFETDYEVHFNSDRTGVRLIGPPPQWARTDGGEAGLHPSNIHDNAYAVGAVDFTGDMPIILGPDGPSLGGFVCPVVVALPDLWKVGQLKPGDSLRFVPADPVPQEPGLEAPTILKAIGSPILGRRDDGPVPVVYRRCGEDNVLVEYGPMVLDLALRLRIHLLAEAVRAAHLPGLIDLTPGIRSLQIHFDPDRLDGAHLVGLLKEIEAGLPRAEEVSVPSRIVHLPLSWNDPQIRLAMRKYQELVRPDAPWCPDNIEFIRRINGLDSQDDVKRIVFDASYLVLGLGDVYLGAPVATPVDPRHRLVTTKYNPARTWTPENAVGIGGAYLCIYGMEGPGGYQLFGRTLQCWNSWRSTDVFHPGTPWLLRFFDQVRFHPVSAEELLEAREAFPHGRYPIRIEETTFSYAEQAAMLAREASPITAFKTRQQAAFEAEREDWKRRGLDAFVSDAGSAGGGDEDAVPAGQTGVESHVTGNVWKVEVAEGQQVEVGQPVVIVESMKMEMAILAPAAGTVAAIRCQPGRTVRAGQVVVTLR